MSDKYTPANILLKIDNVRSGRYNFRRYNSFGWRKGYMVCGKCGHENARKENFCTECGCPLKHGEKVLDSVYNAQTYSAADLSNRKIISLLYGKHYTVLKTIFGVFLLPFVLLLVYFIILFLRPSTYKVPEVDRLSEDFKGTVNITITIVKASRLAKIYDYVNYVALTDDGVRCIVRFGEDKDESIFACLPSINDKALDASFKGVEVKGRCFHTNSYQKKSYVERGLCASAEEFEGLYGRYAVFVGERAEPEISNIFTCFVVLSVIPGFIFLFIGLAVFKKYRILGRDLNRFRKAAIIGLVDGLLINAPYQAKIYRVDNVKGIVFSPHAGRLLIDNKVS